MAAVGKVVEGRMTGDYRWERTRRNGAIVSESNFAAFSYRTEDGKEIVATVRDSLVPTEIQPGRKMLLRYDPENPTYARLATAVAAGPNPVIWPVGVFTLVFGWLSVRNWPGSRRAARQV